MTRVDSLPFDSKNHLSTAMVLAFIIHTFIVFGVGFRLHQDSAASGAIEVTLAKHQSQEQPDEANYLAAVNQLGSGDTDVEKEITTEQLALLDSPVLRHTGPPLPSSPVQPAKHQAEQPIVGTWADSSLKNDSPNEEEQHGDDYIPLQKMREIASLRAKLAHQRQNHSKIPRTLVLTSVNAKASEQAEYLRAWVAWIETVGNENYPEEALRKHIYGEIRLAVTLERDGHVGGVEILQSSGQRVLDQAAIRIVRLAAPFQPIPASIHADRVEVIRTWHFVPGGRLATRAD